MKKILLSVLAAAVALFAAAIVALLNPALQTKAANAALEKYSGSVESLDAGFTSVKIRGAKFDTPSGSFRGDLNLQYSPLALLGKKLKFSGELKNAVLEIKEAAPAAKAAHTPAPEKSDKSAGQNAKKFALPFDIEIREFDAEADVIAAGRTTHAALSLRDVFASQNRLEFRMDASAKNSGEPSLDLKLSAVKLGKILNAKITESGAEILAATTTLNQNLSGVQKCKLKLDSANFAKFEKSLGIKLPKAAVELFAETAFNLDTREYKGKILATAEVSGLKETYATPVDTCAFSLNGDISAKGNCLLSGNVEASAQVDSFPVLGYAFKHGEKLDISAMPADKLLPCGALTLAVPAKLVNAFIKDAEFGAQNISAVFDIAAAPNGTVKISTPQNANIERSRFAKNGQTIFENLTLFVSGEMLRLPDNTLETEVKMESAKVNGKSLAAQIRAKTDGSNTECRAKISGELNPVLYCINSVSSNAAAPLCADADFAAKISAEQLEISEAKVKISGENSENALELKVDGTPVFDIKKSKFAKDFSVKLKAKKFPFAPFKPFANGFDAADISADADAKIYAQDVSADVEFAVEDASFTRDGAQLLRGISAEISAKIKADTAARSFALDDAKVLVKSGAVECCNADISAAASADVGFKLSTAKLSAQMQLKPLFKQPALERFDNIARATASVGAEFKNNAANADIKITNLAVLSTGGEIESLKISANASLGEILSGGADVKINSVRGVSDISAQANNADELTAEVRAGKILADDVLILASAFSNPNAKTAVSAAPKNGGVPAAAAEQKDEKAFWFAGKNAAILAKIGELAVGQNSPLKNFAAKISASQTQLKIQDIAAKILGGKLSGALEVSFDAAAAKPYKFAQTQIALKKFDPAKISQTPMINGIFNAEISLSGEGANAGELFRRATGSATASSDGGTLHLLRDNTDMGRAISAAQSAAKLVNAFLKNDSVDKYTAVADKFRNVNFDSAKIKIERAADLNFNIAAAEFSGNELAFKTQKGVVYFNPDAPLADWDIDIQTCAYTKNPELVSLLARTDALAATSDTDGYKQTRPFKISGKISKPDCDLMSVFFGETAVENPVKLLKKIKLFQ